MMILFIAVAAGVLLGTVLLWLSGYNSGQAVAGAAAREITQEAQNLQRQLEVEQRKNRELQAERKERKAAPAAPPGPPPKTPDKAEKSDRDVRDRDAEEEIARLTSEIARAEGERDKALFELDNVKEELEALHETITKGRVAEKPTSLPKPQKRESRPHSESEALDELQAELDMEKVAHQLVRDDLEQIQKSREILSDEVTKLRRELEQVKKLAAVKLAPAATEEKPASGTRFKTMAIGMRSPLAGGGDQDILRAALEKAQAKTDQLESEIARVRQENQLLKMRSDNSTN